MDQPENKEQASIQRALRQCTLFANLNESEFQSISASCKRVKLKRMETLFRQGEPSRQLYLLESGLIKLFRTSSDGKEKVIDIIRPGVTFAEALLFSSQAFYPVNATATNPSSVLCINSKQYSDILHSSTDACFRVMSQMSARLRAQIAEIDRLALKSAKSRLAYFLCEHKNRSKIENCSHIKLEASKQVIASKLSITPETLSRMLTQFQKEGLIDVNDNDITLMDETRLRLYMS